MSMPEVIWGEKFYKDCTIDSIAFGLTAGAPGDTY